MRICARIDAVKKFHYIVCRLFWLWLRGQFVKLFHVKLMRKVQSAVTQKEWLEVSILLHKLVREQEFISPQ